MFSSFNILNEIMSNKRKRLYSTTTTTTMNVVPYIIRTNKWDSVDDGANSARNRECGVLERQRLTEERIAAVDEDERRVADGTAGGGCSSLSEASKGKGTGEEQGGEDGISRVLGFIPLGRRHRHRWMLRVAGPRAWGVSSARDLLPEGVNLLAFCSNVFSKSDHALIARTHARTHSHFLRASPFSSSSRAFVLSSPRVRRSCETDRSVKSLRDILAPRPERGDS